MSTTPAVDAAKFRALVLQFGGYLEIERPAPGGVWESHAELSGVRASATGASADAAEASAIEAVVVALQVKLGELQNAWTAIVTP